MGGKAGKKSRDSASGLESFDLLWDGGLRSERVNPSHVRKAWDLTNSYDNV